MNTLTDEEMATLEYEWRFWARPDQMLPEGDWFTWLIMSGRGWGKSRTGAETCIEWAMHHGVKRIALVGRTAADVRDVMVEGESGIMAKSPPWFMPHYEPSKRRITWPNGCIATTYSGDKPDQLRGPQHEKAWVDEFAAWRYPESLDMLIFGLRLGQRPQIVATTTPRPTAAVRALMKEPDTHITRGSTYDNAANLSPKALAKLVSKYQGTRLGRQELFGELLDDVPGALWTYGLIEECRVSSHPPFERIVVAIDPAVTSDEESDETGIVVVGLGQDKHGYVLADLTLSASPMEWAKVAVNAYHDFKADRIVAETNNGGDMIESTLRTIDRTISYKKVHASRGKLTRAEPVSSLYEQHRVHHWGMFAELEDQMCNWVPGNDSPDRMDALVWGLTDLMLNAPAILERHENPFFGGSQIRG